MEITKKVSDGKDGGVKEIDYMIIQKNSTFGLTEFENEIKSRQRIGWCCIGSLYIGNGVIRREMIRYGEETGVCNCSQAEQKPCSDGYCLNCHKKMLPKPKKEKPPIDAEYLLLADHLLDLIKTIGGSPNIKVTEAQKNKWANEFRLMVDQDGFEADWIRATLTKVFDAPGSESFAWKHVIRSAGKFREHVKAGKLDHLFAEKKGRVPVW